MSRSADPRKGRWSTPGWLFEPLNTLLRFDLDVAADKGNAKCRRFFSKEKSALDGRPWDGTSWFCNPEYGQEPSTDVWVATGLLWVQRLRNRGCLLVPVKADTAWYHELVWGQNRVVDSAVLQGPLPGRWYRLEEPWGYVELLELRGRVVWGGADGPGWIATAVVLLNAGRSPVLPRLEGLPREVQAAGRSTPPGRASPHRRTPESAPPRPPASASPRNRPGARARQSALAAEGRHTR